VLNSEVLCFRPELQTSVFKQSGFRNWGHRRWRVFTEPLIVQFGFHVDHFLLLRIVQSFVPLVIANVKDYIGDEHAEQHSRAIFQHPNFGLQAQQKVKIFAVVVHVKTKNQNEQVEPTKNGIKYDSVSFHLTGGLGQTYDIIRRVKIVF
jgi:hypothetical protein